MGPPPPSREAAGLAEARAVAHPLRLRIIRLCKDEALTNRELAGRLGVSAGTSLHHVRTLLATGFLVQETTRPGPRGTTEKPYRSTDKSWRLDIEGSSELAAIHQAVLRAVAAELRETDDPVIESARMSMRLASHTRERLRAELRTIVERYANRDEPGGEPLGMLLLMHRRPSPDAGHPVPGDPPPERR